MKKLLLFTVSAAKTSAKRISQAFFSKEWSKAGEH
jgi:hypothetical protein